MSKYDVHIYKNDLTRLIHVTKCACFLYSNRTMENEQEVNEKIKFISQIENEIYEKLDITSSKKCGKILDYFYILLYQTPYSQDVKEYIKNRVYKHCYYLLDYLPFASPKKCVSDDTHKINVQEYTDYYRNLMFYLTEYLQKSKNKQERKIIYETINENLFNYKFLEKIDYSKVKINGREKCITFNFDENLVNPDYENFCTGIITDCIKECLEYSDKDLKNVRNRTTFNITLLYMKVGLSILEKDELVCFMNFYKEMLKIHQGKNKKCIESMTDVIQEIVQEKKDVKQKQKV